MNAKFKPKMLAMCTKAPTVAGAEPTLSDEQLPDAMLTEPILINRPLDGDTAVPVLLSPDQ